MRAQIAVFAALAVACAGGLPWGSSPAPAPPAPPRAPGDFSAERAWEHLRALVEIGPRPSGSEGAARAREYIQAELEKIGIAAETQVTSITLEEGQEPIDVVNIGGQIPGESADAIVLAAPYDTPHFEEFEFVGANDGASGVAVVLELARVIADSSSAYGTWLLFFDGENLPLAPPGQRREGLIGSTVMAELVSKRGDMDRIRLLVTFNKVCDADLRIARDLRSHRPYRQEFWLAAQRLGHEDAFPMAGFESLGGSHLPFIERRLRRVVAISDTSFGGDEPPGLYANSEDDSLEHCAPESLETVGDVTLEALRVITPRLAKIDRFAEVGGEPGDGAERAAGPLDALPPEPEAEPEAAPEEAESASDEPEAAPEAPEVAPEAPEVAPEAPEVAPEAPEVAPEGSAAGAGQAGAPEDGL